MRIITCNIRGSNMNDGDNGWQFRKELCIKILHKYQPDIICFQEMCADQHDDISVSFPDFDYYGISSDTTGMDLFNSIFFNSNKFSLITACGYWLSETPHIPGSKSWDSSCIRFANWARLIFKKTLREFRLINTHLDHVSQTARENQARLICEDANVFPDDYPQILTGDLNCNNTNPAIQLIKKQGWVDTYERFSGTDDNPQTFHEFIGGGCKDNPGKIDWIFMRGIVETRGAGIIRDSENGRYPSDHYFVYADIEL